MNSNIPLIEQSELCPDLDWMIQSSQVGEGELARALTREQLQDLFQIAQIALEDKRLAFEAACETVYLAVAKRHQYSGGCSARAWLYNLAWKTIRRLFLTSQFRRAYKWLRLANEPDELDRFPDGEGPALPAQTRRALQKLHSRDRIGLYLVHNLGFTIEETQTVFGITRQALEKYLEKTNQRLGGLKVDCLPAALQAAWPVPQIGKQELELACDVVHGGQARRQKRRTSSRVVKMTALGGLVLIPILIWLSLSSMLYQSQAPPQLTRYVTVVYVTTTSSSLGIAAQPTSIPSLTSGTE